MPKKPKPMKRPLHPGEKWNKDLHIDRRKEKQEPHTLPGFGGGGKHYYRKDSLGRDILVRGTNKKKSFPAERKEDR